MHNMRVTIQKIAESPTQKSTKESSSYSQSHIWYTRRKCIHHSCIYQLLQWNHTIRPNFFTPNHNFFIWIYGGRSVFNVLKHFFRGKCLLSPQQIPSRIFSIIANSCIFLCSLFFSNKTALSNQNANHIPSILCGYSDRLFFYHDFASRTVQIKSD